MDLQEFLATYNPNNEHDILGIDITSNMGSGTFSRFVAVKHHAPDGGYRGDAG